MQPTEQAFIILRCIES